jgi:hypothetical protein
LSWGQVDEKAGELLVTYNPNVPLDIMQFKKKAEGNFFSPQLAE